MKHQSILINTSEDLSIDKINEFLEENFDLSEKISEMNHIEIFSDKNTIGIAELEEIPEFINLRSDNLKYVLIRKAETLTPEAQNSLLKNIEEPPEDTIFILITKNVEKILETIKSRCLVFFLKSQKSHNADFQVLAQKIISSDYLERLKIVEKLSKDYETREELAEIIFEVIKSFPQSNHNYKEKIETLKSIYIGVKSSVNLKLSLDLLAITLEK